MARRSTRSGEVIDESTSSRVGTRDGVVIQESASTGSTGTSATTNANDTSSASGTTTILGASATTNANDTSAASGVVGSAVTGSSATTNANDASASSGTTTVRGTSATTNANDTSNASGWSGVVSGTSATTNQNDTSTASGVAAGAVTTGGGIWIPKRRKGETEEEKRIRRQANGFFGPVEKAIEPADEEDFDAPIQENLEKRRSLNLRMQLDRLIQQTESQSAQEEEDIVFVALMLAEA